MILSIAYTGGFLSCMEMPSAFAMKKKRTSLVYKMLTFVSSEYEKRLHQLSKISSQNHNGKVIKPKKYTPKKKNTAQSIDTTKKQFMIKTHSFDTYDHFINKQLKIAALENNVMYLKKFMQTEYVHTRIYCAADEYAISPLHWASYAGSLA